MDFAPANAVTVGFFCGALGQFLAIAGTLIFHSPVMIIAGFVTLFFDNASIAVYAKPQRWELKAANDLTVYQWNHSGIRRSCLCLCFTVSSIRWMAWKLRLLNNLPLQYLILLSI